MTRPPLPPFTAESAAHTRDPAKVALAYSVDSIWRNRAEFIRGREAIEAFSHASGFASWSIG
jgi:nuclear transport factor 2 (NTF2) superfamily protein